MIFKKKKNYSALPLGFICMLVSKFQEKGTNPVDMLKAVHFLKWQGWFLLMLLWNSTFAFWIYKWMIVCFKISQSNCSQTKLKWHMVSISRTGKLALTIHPSLTLHTALLTECLCWMFVYSHFFWVSGFLCEQSLFCSHEAALNGDTVDVLEQLLKQKYISQIRLLS